MLNQWTERGKKASPFSGLGPRGDAGSNPATATTDCLSEECRHVFTTTHERNTSRSGTPYAGLNGGSPTLTLAVTREMPRAYFTQ